MCLGSREEGTLELGVSTDLDCGANPTHQAEVVVQVVDRIESRAQDLVAAVEVPQIGAAVVPAGITVAAGIEAGSVDEVLRDYLPREPATSAQVSVA